LLELCLLVSALLLINRDLGEAGQTASAHVRLLRLSRLRLWRLKLHFARQLLLEILYEVAVEVVREVFFVSRAWSLYLVELDARHRPESCGLSKFLIHFPLFFAFSKCIGFEILSRSVIVKNGYLISSSLFCLRFKMNTHHELLGRLHLRIDVHRDVIVRGQIYLRSRTVMLLANTSRR